MQMLVGGGTGFTGRRQQRFWWEVAQMQLIGMVEDADAIVCGICRASMTRWMRRSLPRYCVSTNIQSDATLVFTTHYARKSITYRILEASEDLQNRSRCPSAIARQC